MELDRGKGQQMKKYMPFIACFMLNLFCFGVPFYAKYITLGSVDAAIVDITKREETWVGICFAVILCWGIAIVAHVSIVGLEKDTK
jgi:hypothetical protein